MARKRMIDPKFWTDDKIIELEPISRLLFIGIWNFADDKGVHLNNSKVLKAEIFPADTISIVEVETMKDELCNLGMIEISEDKKLFKIRNWEIYQKINRPQPSKYEFSECSVNVPTPFIPKEREGKGIEGNIIKGNISMEQKVKKPKPSALKPYNKRVEEFFNDLDPDFRKILEEAYPNVDIDKELVKARAWLLVNTHKAKKQFKRFVNNWISSAMENAGRYNSTASQEHMVKLNEERIERDRKRQHQYMEDNKKEAASQEEVSEILGNIVKKMEVKKDVKPNEN